MHHHKAGLAFGLLRKVLLLAAILVANLAFESIVSGPIIRRRSDYDIDEIIRQCSQELNGVTLQEPAICGSSLIPIPATNIVRRSIWQSPHVRSSTSYTYGAIHFLKSVKKSTLS